MRVPGVAYGNSTDDGSMSLLLLLQRGYKITYGNVRYEMENLEGCPRANPHDANVSVEDSIENGCGELPNFRIRLLRSDRCIGEVSCESAWHKGPSRHSQQECQIKDFDVEDEEQGHGLGRHLLGEAVYKMRKLGYTKTAGTTGVGNLRTRMLCTSMGFKQGTTEHILVKDLEATGALGVMEVGVYDYPERLT